MTPACPSRSRKWIGWTAAALLASAVLLLALESLAAGRPGGGQSFSGGSSSGGSSRSSSSSGSSSGGSGGGELFFLLIQICFQYPAVGIPLLLVVVAVFVIYKMNSKGEEWSSGSEVDARIQQAYGAVPTLANRASLRQKLADTLRPHDPAFSLAVFEDFFYFLYAQMQRARGQGAGEVLTPYLGDGARAALRSDGRLAGVTGIVIGSMEYESVDVQSGAVRVQMTLDVNYVEQLKGGGEARFYARDRITLRRNLSARSRAPEQATVLHCPNCGAPLSAMRGSTCTYCKTVITPGEKDWCIESMATLQKETRGPLLTSDVAETGTELRTVVDPRATSALQAVNGKDAAFQWPRFEARVRHIFQELQSGWTARDPLKVRPFMSDNLFQSQCYFIDLYKAAHAINRLDNTVCERVELASVTTDAYYDAITVRLYASGLDFTVSEDGKLLSGNPKKARRYSEYWTLLRGAQQKTAPKDDRNCPNCGAPLNVTMTGNCNYCRAKVTTGEFEWVLSRIEQDEAYRG